MDKYKKGNLLGKGSFGIVYKATAIKTGEEVVLKEINITKMTAKEKDYIRSEVFF